MNSQLLFSLATVLLSASFIGAMYFYIKTVNIRNEMNNFLSPLVAYTTDRFANVKIIGITSLIHTALLTMVNILSGLGWLSFSVLALIVSTSFYLYYYPVMKLYQANKPLLKKISLINHSFYKDELHNAKKELIEIANGDDNADDMKLKMAYLACEHKMKKSAKSLLSLVENDDIDFARFADLYLYHFNITPMEAISEHDWPKQLNAEFLARLR